MRRRGVELALSRSHLAPKAKLDRRFAMLENQARGRHVMHPGEVLKALRADKGWTLQDLSKRTGLPISTLSKIEHGKMSLTYDKITKLSRGLEVDIERIFGQDAPDVESPQKFPTGRRSIERKGEGVLMDSDVYESIYPAADLLHKKMVPIITEVKARSREEFGPLLQHSGEEYTYVIEGAIELHTDLYAPLRLEAGDSIYFDSSMAHAYIAVGPEKSKLITVCSAGSVDLKNALEASQQFANSDVKVITGNHG